MPEGQTPRPKVPTTPQDLSGPGDAFAQFFGDATEMAYIVGEIRERHVAALLQDGEDFFWLKRKLSGTRCPFWDDQQQQCRAPLSADATCFNTGWIGGYEAPMLLKVALPTAAREALATERGVVKSQQMRPWTIWEPRLSERDLLVRSSSGERFEVLNAQETGPWRGLIVAQFFDVRPLQLGSDLAMQVTVVIPGGPR